MRTPQNSEIDPAEVRRPELRTDIVSEDAFRPNRRDQHGGGEDAVLRTVHRKPRNPGPKPFQDLVRDAHDPPAFWRLRALVAPLMPGPFDLDSLTVHITAPQREDLRLAHTGEHDEVEAKALPLG